MSDLNSKTHGCFYSHVAGRLPLPEKMEQKLEWPFWKIFTYTGWPINNGDLNTASIQNLLVTSFVALIHRHNNQQWVFNIGDFYFGNGLQPIRRRSADFNNLNNLNQNSSVSISYLDTLRGQMVFFIKLLVFWSQIGYKIAIFDTICKAYKLVW